MKTLLLIIVSLLSFSNQGFSQYHDSILSQHHFKDEIIRSYDVDLYSNKEFIIGMKGSSLGSGKLYRSEDEGVSWKPLNQGRPLCDSCIDVQAVKMLGKEIILAGTWQNGLYRSSDNGASFSKLQNFPSTDIRSITKDLDAVYAATTTHGILKSEDEGLTWATTHPDSLNKQMAAWHIEVNPHNKRHLYACTFGQDLRRSEEEGKTWTSVCSKEGVMFFDIAFTGKIIYAIAASDSASYLYSSLDYGKSWREKKLEIQSACALEVVFEQHSHHILVGAWTGGLYRLFPLQYGANEFLMDPVEHFDSTGVTKIFSHGMNVHKFTWGDGYKKYERPLGCDFFMPNILSLDSDPEFEAASSCALDGFHLILYNRWGEIVIDNEKDLDSFNEQMRSLPDDTPDGTYVFWIRGTFKETKIPFDYKGHITILK